ncbi:MAG: histidine--tRNA ligase [Spirochaetaceae bacterium]|jgi:histidyl-tRNA synthetase|nr:histidine--tRNA ligase [Spirochaetaceae bacterium]
MPLIEPRVLKGFRDFLPPQELARRNMVEKIEKSFRSFGFIPIDTPALEYAEILLGKGGGETEKQIYRFTDHGGRDVALRFDLTVPFARFVAEHRGDLVLPFKRYHIAKVWRGENTQRGRYREFTQCDFDIVGSDGAAADFEILLMIRNTLRPLCGDGVVIRLNHRGLFNRFLSSLGVMEQSAEILRQVDKLAKVGKDGVQKLLEEITGKTESLRILDFVSLEAEGDYETVLEALKAKAGEGEDTRRLEELRRFMKDAGAADGFILDPSITRGLDYYTGVVYETFLTGLPDIGSICSGGRYDNLAGLYSKDKICGVGSSIGLDRLQAALEILDAENAHAGSCCAALACLEAGDAGKAQKAAEAFRLKGITCEVFLEPKKLTQQFMLAEKKGIPWVIIPEDDYSRFTLRNIAARENKESLDVEDAADAMAGM